MPPGPPASLPAYRWHERWLHAAVLSRGFVGEALFDLEVARYDHGEAQFPDAPVLVTGLARSGSTALLHALHGTGAFASLTYADMPFVLAPNTWRALRRSSPAGSTRSERAHGDGLQISQETPEAFEEVFWRVFDGHCYLQGDGLRSYRPAADTFARYQRYRRMVQRAHGGGRYLAKNNNALVRLAALCGQLPRLRVLVPFRPPLQQAHSLLAMHRRFGALRGFGARYLIWLGHHEFGRTHRPFRLDDAGYPGTPDHLDYWLATWIAAYRHVLQVRDALPATGAIRLVAHDRLLDDPGYWRELAAWLGIPAASQFRFDRRPAREVVMGASADLLAEAGAIYEQMLAAPDQGGAIQTSRIDNQLPENP